MKSGFYLVGISSCLLKIMDTNQVWLKVNLERKKWEWKDCIVLIFQVRKAAFEIFFLLKHEF